MDDHVILLMKGIISPDAECPLMMMLMMADYHRFDESDPSYGDGINSHSVADKSRWGEGGWPVTSNHCA